MSAPNDFGSNLIKARIVMPIDETGAPIGPSNPAAIEILIGGEPVSDSNPVPVVSVD